MLLLPSPKSHFQDPMVPREYVETSEKEITEPMQKLLVFKVKLAATLFARIMVLVTEAKHEKLEIANMVMA